MSLPLPLPQPNPSTKHDVHRNTNNNRITTRSALVNHSEAASRHQRSKHQSTVSKTNSSDLNVGASAGSVPNNVDSWYNANDEVCLSSVPNVFRSYRCVFCRRRLSHLSGSVQRSNISKGVQTLSVAAGSAPTLSGSLWRVPEVPDRHGRRLSACRNKAR